MTSSQRWSGGRAGYRSRRALGPPANSAPTAPARYATALYRPYTWLRSRGGVEASIDCSMVVIGPDSFGSVDRVPVSAASTSTGIEPVTANVAPATPMTASSTMYVRRRPNRSPQRPTASDEIAMPSSMAVKIAPTAAASSPDAASDAPMRMLLKP